MSKPGAKADVPVGVIVGSIIGGLLLLALVVAALWKVWVFFVVQIVDARHQYKNWLQTSL